MSSLYESKKLFDRSGIRSYCALLAYSIAIILLLPGCIHGEDLLKVSIDNGESILIGKSFVKYVNIESDDRKYERYAVVYLSQEGDEALYNLFVRNVGKTISVYYGERQVRTGTLIIEPYRIGSIWLDLTSAKDENMAAQLIKDLSWFQKTSITRGGPRHWPGVQHLIHYYSDGLLSAFVIM